jgi:predicted DNA-binding WGR domain protein
LEELAILLEASEPRLNRHRFWRADVSRDLFGDWRTDILFGRIGGRGRTFSKGFATRQEAKAFLEAALKRRRGALRRCGVAYSLIEATAGPDGPSDGEICTLISGTRQSRTPRPRMPAGKRHDGLQARRPTISAEGDGEESFLLDQDGCKCS